ncbi:MAG: nuclear protein [Alphaproteobacteria bacterium]|nr:nuclear protein [Alphaproteobacteria bacterium]
MTFPFDPRPGTLVLPQPYILFVGDTREAGYAKTAFGLRDWAGDKCVGECASDEAAVTTGLPRMSPAEGAALGARSLIVAVANSGGYIPQSWIATLIEALEAGLDIVAGMHSRLSEIDELADAARRLGRRLIDVRTPPPGLTVATGAKRSGKRLLTVGTDCALGKKYTALALTEGFVARGIDADFRATGQTGIMIAGEGIPMDAVIADFEAGAAERLSPDAAPDHWDVIEGQGSLMHPAYSGVSLGLLHGSQPDVFVLCHEPGRTGLLGLSSFELPLVEDMIALTITLGRRTNQAIRCGGLSFNTSAFSQEEAERLMAAESDRLSLPVADSMRRGAAFDRLIDNCLREA